MPAEISFSCAPDGEWLMPTATKRARVYPGAADYISKARANGRAAPERPGRQHRSCMLWHAANRLPRRVPESNGDAGLRLHRSRSTTFMARMLGAPHGTVVDPFCGTGLLLAEVAEHAKVLDAEFHGQDVNAFVVNIAAALAPLAVFPLSVEQRDLRWRVLFALRIGSQRTAVGPTSG